MKTAAVVYRSRTGVTRRFAEAIGAQLAARGIDTRVVSIGECDLAGLVGVDYLLLGCWTDGLMIALQHPDQPWIDFARAMPAVTTARVGLFTTYRFATGRMFRQMERHLSDRTSPATLQLKSRDGRLSEDAARALDAFIGA